MVRNFFDGLTETLTRTTKDLGKKANQIYETQKLQSRAASEAHQAEKLQTEIGVLLYKRYKDGETLDGEIAALCEKIDLHMEAIAKCKDTAANLKGCKLCPSCGKSVDKEASFCPYCGTPCPVPEPAKEAEDEWSCDWEDEEPAEETEEEEPAETAEEESAETENIADTETETQADAETETPADTETEAPADTAAEAPTDTAAEVTAEAEEAPADSEAAPAEPEADASVE